jgi:hypothetical protein
VSRAGLWVYVWVVDVEVRRKGGVSADVWDGRYSGSINTIPLLIALGRSFAGGEYVRVMSRSQ